MLFIITLALRMGVTFQSLMVEGCSFTYVKPENIFDAPQSLEVTEEYVISPPPKSKVSYGFSSGMNFLNIMGINQHEFLKEKTYHVSKFKDDFEENYLDMTPVKNHKNSTFPFSKQVPSYASRFHSFPSYRDLNDTPNEFEYFSRNRDQMLGNMVKTHIVNVETPEMREDVKKSWGIDLEEKPMYWTPVHKDRKKLNRIIQKSDYARFVYFCQWYKQQTDLTTSEERNELNNDIRFWYKDSSNTPSAVRSFAFTDILERFSTKAYTYVGGIDPIMRTNNPYVDSELKKKLLEALKNKILVIEHKRINLTVGKGMSNCPILTHYIKQGWKLSDKVDGNDLYTEIFEKVANDYKDINPSPGEDCGTFKLGRHYSGYYVGTQYTDFKCLKSVTLTKTTFIDVEEVGLDHLEGVYVKEVDLVFGKIKVPGPTGMRYPVDYIHHPKSIDGASLDNDNLETLEILYVNNRQVSSPPLYLNTHGMISKISPRRDSNYRDGVYMVKRKGNTIMEIVGIPEEARMAHGVFTTKEDALAYSKIAGSVMEEASNYYNHQLHSVKFQDAMELERLKANNVRMQYELSSDLKMKDHNYKTTEYELKAKEQETRMKELEFKASQLDLEVQKLRMLQLPATVAAALKPVVEISQALIKAISIFKGS